MGSLITVSAQVIPRFDLEIEALLPRLQAASPSQYGKLVRVVGLTLEATGISAPLGALCEVGSSGSKTVLSAEVVGFHGDITYLMPLSNPEAVAPGAKVTVVSPNPAIRLGNSVLGRVIDGLGDPMDGKGPIRYPFKVTPENFRINPMERGAINKPLDTGIKAINACLTLGRGQRIGLMAGSGVGKSVLLGMLTRNTEADVVVIGLIGERGREVQEFITETLGDSGLEKSVVVAAPADVSPVMRLKATNLTHLIAEYFRDQGKNVLLLCDSLTRVAHAQREVGLAIGEPPTAKGYPPSVFATIPRLIERAGVGKHGHGSITSIYTVLAEGDDRADPIIDIARASLDGHVMLSRQLADAAHYPAIDVSGSISRVMANVVSEEHLQQATRFRRLWGLYHQNKDLVQVGAYEAGTNRELDQAISLLPQMEALLQQPSHVDVRFKSCSDLLQSVVG